MVDRNEDLSQRDNQESQKEENEQICFLCGKFNARLKVQSQATWMTVRNAGEMTSDFLFNYQKVENIGRIPASPLPLLVS